tara:strand:- start:863 stop:1078 length:216 start_codon:yes stop_codon:yes gene_type:complete
MENEVTLLYTDELLDMVYRIYAKHQGKHNVPFITLENFKDMFEEQQTAIYQQQIEDMKKLFDDDPNNRFPN